MGVPQDDVFSIVCRFRDEGKAPALSWEPGGEELEASRGREEVASLTLIECGGFLLSLFLIGCIECDELVGLPGMADDENPQIFYWRIVIRHGFPPLCR